MYKSGFVTVVGRPNVGKSTLLNKVIGEKISIISDKPQTTRNKILLIYTEENSQIIFIDTPGIQMPRNKLGEYMLKTSKSTLEEVDVITFMVDNSLEIGKMDSMIIEDLKMISTPIILLINKIDELKEEEVLQLIDKYNNMNMFEEIIPMSALNNINVDKYIEILKKMVPEGPQYFPGDMITDQPERFIVSEIIREKALVGLEEEVPHGIYVSIDSMKKREDKDIVDVLANIIVEKKSHKGIVIGKEGKKIKQIGSFARRDIETLLGSKVNLKLWVKVEKNWREKESKVKYFGYK
ncbi:MAG TPA: GTPase Era [Tissierellaceae bacterium]|nr:GTPase Era [Tissierellaceae bacterium]